MIKFLENNKHYVLLLIILVAIQINFFSSLSATPIPGPSWPIIPTLYHFFIFLTLNFLILIYVIRKKKIKWSYLLLSAAISVIFAIVDELDQLFVPMRFASIKDVLIDSAGIFLSTIIYSYIKVKKEKPVTTSK